MQFWYLDNYRALSKFNTDCVIDYYLDVLPHHYVGVFDYKGGVENVKKDK